MKVIIELKRNLFFFFSGLGRKIGNPDYFVFLGTKKAK